MARTNLQTYKFAKIYPLLVAKAEKKGRTRAEVDEVIHWLTGYDAAGIAKLLEEDADYGRFIGEAPAWNPASTLITGTICGHRVEAIEDPFLRRVRELDKLVDELARGKAMEKIKRS